MRFSTLSLAALASFTCTVSALSPADWKKQSIYQVMTDRFARTDGSTTAACDTSADKYCGGSWQGIINKLDYIQDMGFTAVSLRHGLAPSLDICFTDERTIDLDIAHCGKSASGWRLSWILGSEYHRVKH